jgi:hypothetical protein
MLVVRRAQLDVLREAALRQLEQRICELMRRYWLEACDALTAAELRELVRDGVTRGRSHGLASERDLTRFVNVMFALGFEFDSDPQCAWAVDVLRTPGVPASTRMDQLCELTARRLE